MSEKIYMNQNIVYVELFALDEDKDILRFKFEDEQIDVNLNSSLCQNDLKAVFVRLIQMLLEGDVYLQFSPEDDYNRRMYIEVCEEYIKDLNRELVSTKEKIVNELL